MRLVLGRRWGVHGVPQMGVGFTEFHGRRDGLHKSGSGAKVEMRRGGRGCRGAPYELTALEGYCEDNDRAPGGHRQAHRNGQVVIECVGQELRFGEMFKCIPLHVGNKARDSEAFLRPRDCAGRQGLRTPHADQRPHFRCGDDISQLASTLVLHQADQGFQGLT